MVTRNEPRITFVTQLFGDKMWRELPHTVTKDTAQKVGSPQALDFLVISLDVVVSNCPRVAVVADFLVLLQLVDVDAELSESVQLVFVAQNVVSGQLAHAQLSLSVHKAKEGPCTSCQNCRLSSAFLSRLFALRNKLAKKPVSLAKGVDLRTDVCDEEFVVENERDDGSAAS